MSAKNLFGWQSRLEPGYMDGNSRAKKGRPSMAKTKSDKELYGRLRASGIRKKVARLASDALPAKGQKKPVKAHKLADQLSTAADAIRQRAGGGARKRSSAAKKAARTRKGQATKRRASARKGAKARAKK